MAISKSSNSEGLQAWTVSELGDFYTQHRSEFHAHAARILKDNAKAEEVLQDALIKVMLAAPELESTEHALSYVHRTIENICIDIFRIEGRRPNLVVLDDATAEVESVWQVNADHADVVAAADDAAIVRQALAMLSPAERAALVMWEMEGRSTSEIAAELGIKESAVRHTVSRARTSLRRVLSELIVDEERGLTALDLLSTTYKKAARVAKKSSKVALSLLLVMTAFLGFNSMSGTDSLLVHETPAVISSEVVETSPVAPTTSPTTSPSTSSTPTAKNKSVPAVVDRKSAKQTDALAAKPVALTFPGLDKDGIPTAFTVTDGTNAAGVLFVTKRPPLLTDSGMLLTSLAMTRSIGPNVLINQTFAIDGTGTTFTANISVGINRIWVPLSLSYITTDIERLASGNYLVTAILMVDSAVETAITVPSSANGADLVSVPKSITIRVLLNASKSQILAEAVLVTGNSKVGKA